MTREFWEAAANRDPLWAILSNPSKRGRQWDLREFFETGRREISLLLYQLEQLRGMPLRRRALDFGCGVGRLTQPLAAFFDEVVGVDISPTMIRLAERLNRGPGKVRYVLGTGEDLREFTSNTFDFLYSDIVLQHLPPESSQRYISEFLRVLAPGGVAVFQLPSHRRAETERQPQPVAMPDTAYRGAIEAIEAPPSGAAPNQSIHVLLRATNTSPVRWEPSVSGPIRVGNHWLSPAGTMLVQDDGRATIPAVVQPNQAFVVGLAVTAPLRPGQYVCEFDFVHEGISWFHDKGCPTLRVSVDVGVAHSEVSAQDGPTLAYPDLGTFPDIYAELRPEAPEIDWFPMHGVPKDVVLELIARCGGSAFYIEPDERGGHEWVGFRYFVRKDS